MRLKKFLLLFVLLFCALIGCDKTKQVVSIEVDQNTVDQPLTLAEFDLSDIVIIVTMDDGTQQRVELNENMISQADLAKLNGPGEHTITVTAYNKTIQIRVTITNEMWQIFRLAQESGSITVSYEEWLASIKGDDGKNPVFRIEAGWLQWQYQGDTSWNNLLEIATLKGSNGKDISLRVANGAIEWQHSGDANWQQLVSLATLTGANGREIALRVAGGYIQWQYQGDSTWQNLIQLSSLAGDSGEDGLSAYELYKLHHPEYDKSEEEWLDDLVNGRLGDFEYYTVTFDPKGGVLPEGTQGPVVVPAGSTIALPIPTKEGYVFMGWVTGFTVVDGKFTNVTPVSRNLTLYADWKSESEMATLTYYTIEEIAVREIIGDIIYGDDGHYYIPRETIVRSDTKEEVILYGDANEFFEVEFGVSISSILFFHSEVGLIAKTADGEFFGAFDSNNYGQYGVGHNNHLEEPFCELFTGIDLEDGEFIEHVYVFGTYNLVITDTGRVFLTGTIKLDTPVVAWTPLEITDEFALEEGEFFLPQDVYTYAFPGLNEIVYTNRRSFGLTDFFESFIDEDFGDGLYMDLALLTDAGDELLCAFYSTEAKFTFYATVSGYIMLKYEEMFTGQMDLAPGETLITHNLGYYFATNQGRLITIMGANSEGLEIVDVADYFDITGKVVEIYVGVNFNKGPVYIILITDEGHVYRVKNVEEIEDMVVEDITEVLEEFGEGTFFSRPGMDGINLYYEADGNLYTLSTENIESYVAPILVPVVKSYDLDQEVRILDYRHPKYAIIGWLDYNTGIHIGVKLTVTRDYELIPRFADLIEVELYIADNIVEFYVIEGQILTEEEILSHVKVPYGWRISKIETEFHEEFEEQEIWWYGTYFSIILEPAPGAFVGVTYVDSEGNIIDYEDIMVEEGDNLSHPEIVFNPPRQYTIAGFYSDLALSEPFDLNQDITEGLIVYVKLQEKDKHKVTLVLAEGEEIFHYVHDGLGLNEDALKNLIVLQDYLVEGIYYDEGFTNQFYFEYIDEDLELYVKLIWVKYIAIEYYHEGTLVYADMVKFVEGDQANIIPFPNNYVVKGIYLDPEFTQELSVLTDKSITTIYVDLELVAGYDITIAFSQTDLSFIIPDFRGNYSKLYDIVSEFISNNFIPTGLPLQLFTESDELFFDVPIDSDMTLVANLDSFLIKIDFVFDDMTISFWHKHGYGFDLSRLNDMLSAYAENNNLDQIFIATNLYYDLQKTNEYLGEAVFYEGYNIILFATYLTTDLHEVTISVPGWDVEPFNLYIQPYNALYLYDVVGRLLDMGFIDNHYLYALYTDEDFTTLYQPHAITADEQVYLKIALREPVALTVEFPELGIPSITLYPKMGEQYPYMELVNYLSAHYFGYSISHRLYLDEDFETLYGGSTVEDLTVYAKVVITNMITIYIHYPFSGERPEMSVVDAGFVFTDYTGVYYDPEFTIPFDGAPIMADIHLFIKSE
jgi:uncharacterized repeat protein (TIGR02543 family)